MNQVLRFGLWAMMLIGAVLFFLIPTPLQACYVDAEEVSRIDNGDGSVTYDFASPAGKTFNVDFAKGVVPDAVICNEVVGEIGHEDAQYYASCRVDASTTEWTVTIWPADATYSRVYVDVDQQIDYDGDGSTICDDCDDADPAIYPGAIELCDGIDNNCNGQMDEGTGAGVFYPDTDGDGYGAGASVQACSMPDGYVTNADDCDDANPAIYPVATEVCDGSDNNCNGQIDDSVVYSTYYPDADGDGYGKKGDAGMIACAPPKGYVDNNLDCNDKNAAVNPSAEEICDDMDNDCTAVTNENEMFDTDGDGYLTCDPQPDCNEGDPSVHPKAVEVCDDGIDQNCDGVADDGCVDEESPTPFDTPTLGGDDDDGTATTPDVTMTPTFAPDDTATPSEVSSTNIPGDDDSPADTPGAGDDDDRPVTPTPSGGDEAGKGTTGCGCTTGTSELPASWSMFVVGLVWLWRSRRRAMR